ncbi:MAG TPA: SlyX protein [Alphaproteobacteria bacterium]|nr:SlyX protein [Alphaproteobacteria bacterium]
MTQAIVELEIRLEHQEAALNELSDVVAKQQRMIDRLLAEVRHLSSAQAQEAETPGSAADEVPPPHY